MPTLVPNRAVFLDRDGVMIEDMNLLIERARIRILKGVPQALANLHKTGFALIVVSNQTVVSRGLATEQDVIDLNVEINSLVEQNGGPHLEAFYFCPHHPNATVLTYRLDCECRKPRPGLLIRAACERDLDLRGSFMVGDRITDIIAGARAGCRTVLVETGAHWAPPIETNEPLDLSIRPDHACADLTEAARWILEVA